MSEFLMPLVQSTKEEILSYIKEIYRTSSRYIIKHLLPREIFINFTSKKMRDTILYNSNDAVLDYKGKRVKILKEIPFLAQKRRFKYKILAVTLIKKDIKYRWLYAEGLF